MKTLRLLNFFIIAIISLLIASCDDSKEEPNPEPKPEVTTVALDKCVGGIYFGDFWNQGYGDYYFLLSNCEVGSGSGGMEVPMNPGGYLLFCDIWSELSTDHTNPILPEGVYSASEERANGVFTLELTLCTVNKEKVGDKYRIEDILFTDGVIVVEHIAEGYDILAQFITTDGELIRFTYRGEIKFDDYSNDEEWKWEIGKDVVMQPKLVTRSVYEDEGYDNYQILCFDTEKITDDGMHPNEAGTKMQLSLLVAKGKDISGNYTSGNGVGCFVPGTRMGAFAAGSFCERVNKDLSISYCLMTGGDVNINKNSDGTYSFKVNMTTSDGYKVTGDWTSNIEELSDGIPPQTTLTSDVVFNPIQCSEIRYFGDYYGTGTSNFNVTFADADELIMFDVCAKANDGKSFPTGEYVISDTNGVGTLVAGSVSSNSAAPSCYVRYDLSTGDAVDVAPIVGGKLTVTELNGVYTFTFDVVDDFDRNDKSKTPHRISGKWSGNVPEIVEHEMAPINIMKNRYLKQKSLKLQMQPMFVNK